MRFLALLLVFTGLAACQQIVATGPTRWFAGTTAAITDASPVFLSDDQFGLLVKTAAGPDTKARLLILSVAGANISIAAQATERSGWWDSRLHAATANRLLVTSHLGTEVYSPGLKLTATIPLPELAPRAPRSNVIGENLIGENPIGENPIGENPGDRWRLFRPDSSYPFLSGRGRLLSVSDDRVVYRAADQIKVQTTTGAPLAAFAVNPSTKESLTLDILDGNRLYLSLETAGRVVSLTGKDIGAIDPPDGWGFWRGRSNNGNRILFDHQTKAVPPWGHALEVGLETIGFGVKATPVGETVRVIDTTTGATCLNLSNPVTMLGAIGGYHADLSPSGRLVAVASRSTLTVYRLPDVCR